MTQINCFFGLILYITENTLCLSYYFYTSCSYITWNKTGRFVCKPSTGPQFAPDRELYKDQSHKGQACSRKVPCILVQSQPNVVCRQISVTLPKIKFYKNASGGSREDRQTDKTKLITAFCYSTSAPKPCLIQSIGCASLHSQWRCCNTDALMRHMSLVSLTSVGPGWATYSSGLTTNTQLASCLLRSAAVVHICINVALSSDPCALSQRFSNFFQVGTTFISQNVPRTTLLLGLSNSLGLP